MKESLLEDSTESEMSFVDHLEALRWHLLRSLGAVVIFMIIAFLNKKIIFDYILFGPTRNDFPTNKLFCWVSEKVPFLNMCSENLHYQFINTDLAGQFMLHLKMSAVMGFVLAFPYIFWEIWRFVRPALYRNEIQVTRGVVLFSSLFFTLGCCFGYFIIAPFSINFFYSYTAIEIAQNFISIDNYISNVISMVIPTGIMFELPMLVYFLSKIGLIGPALLINGRRFAYVIILIVIAVITPQGDMISLMLVSSPVILLYELSILVSKRVSAKFAEDFD